MESDEVKLIELYRGSDERGKRNILLSAELEFQESERAKNVVKFDAKPRPVIRGLKKVLDSHF